MGSRSTSVDDPVAILAGRTLARARADLRIAGKLQAERIDDEAWAAVFHAQQAAEKAIKAVLVAHQSDFPKTHDLARLVTFLPKRSTVPVSADDLECLSFFATAGRYVIDDATCEAEPGWEDAAEAIRMATELVGFAGRALSPGPVSRVQR